jgi:methionyl-tRNA synthetase
VEGYPEDTKRIYVWFDAVIGYLSASLECAAMRGEPESWREWWQNPDSTHAYFMGKDNIVFHTVIWPSMLIGYGEGGEIGAGKGELHLPDEVVASEFLMFGEEQMSASRGVGINVRDVLVRFDADTVRYYLTAAGPETQDSSFSWEEFVRRNNDELLANWGNLVNRTLTNVYRNFGEVPAAGTETEADRAVLDGVAAAFDSVGELIERSRFKAALAEAMRASTLANQYISEQAPWATIKTDRDRAATVLNVSLACVDTLKILFTPFLPFSSQTLHELLGYDDVLAGELAFRDVTDGDASHTVLTGDYGGWRRGWEPSRPPEGQKLREPTPLFKKLDPV